MAELTREQDQAAEALASEYRSVEEVQTEQIGDSTILVVLAHDSFEDGVSRFHALDQDGVLRARWEHR